MRGLLLGLRITVLVLSVLGAAVSAFLALSLIIGEYKLRKEYDRVRAVFDEADQAAKKRGLSEENRREADDHFRAEDDKFEKDLENLNRVLNATPFLVVGALLSIVGGILAMLGRTNSGGGLLLLAGLGPVPLAPRAVIFTGVLILAGLLACLASFLAFQAGPERTKGKGRR
jgi:hypothetical protein